MDKKQGPADSLSPEIFRLTEKLAKDPKSRLFMPLAEEYLKSGMPDEAFMVLTDGLKIHPTFHTARALLGRVLLEKGQVAEAKAELEQVIQASPDNLLAHRKLAKIYKDEGQTDKARGCCRAVLSLNSKDPEMKSIMEEIDRMEKEAQQRAQKLGSMAATQEMAEMPVERTAHVQTPPPAEPPAAEEKKAGAPVKEMGPVSPDEPAGVVVPAEPERVAAPESEKTSDSTLPVTAKSEPVLSEPEPASPPVMDLKEEPTSLEEILGSIPAETPEPKAASPAPMTEPVQVAEPSMEEEAEAAQPLEEITTEALADLYIKQGHYDKGISIYRRLLAKDPNNQVLYKKLEEAVEMVRVLSEGPQIRKGKRPEPQIPASEAESPAVSERERQRMLKIQRLQMWLDHIKKEQGQ